MPFRTAFICGLCGEEGRPHLGSDGEPRISCPGCQKLWRVIEGQRVPSEWKPVPPAILKRCGGRPVR